MKRIPLGPLVAVLLLDAAFGALPASVVPSGLGGTAQAEENSDSRDATRDRREQRRALKFSELDKATISEVYAQKAREKRHESMAMLKKILAENQVRGEQKAEMLLRLAELYFEEGRDDYLVEMKKYADAFDKCHNTPGCNPDDLKPDHTESERWQRKAIALYKEILQSYPQYQRADEATYYLASALEDMGEKDMNVDKQKAEQEMEEAVREFTRLVRTYPQSPFVPDAYVMIGEYWFNNKNNAYKALVAYQHAARYKDTDKYSFAMYKLAWCYYNVGEYGKAIDTMKTVVTYSRTAQEGENAQAQKKRLTLQDEALKDLVRFFADAGQMDEAYQYFSSLGKKDLIKDMLKRLAKMYFDQGKFDQSINTYRRLIAENPESVDAPEYQNEIILAYQKIGKKKETLGEIQRMLKTYGKGSAWARAHSADQDAIERANEYLEKNLRTVAINYHSEAKKLGTGSSAREAYALAYKAYQTYLEQFPTGQHTYEMRYAFAELLYKIKKYDQAYDQYMKVVAIDPKGKRSRFCAESAIFAADKMIKREAKAGKGSPPPANKTDPISLSEWENKLLKACDQYAKYYPDSEKVRNIIYKSAYLLYHHNMFKDASDRFRKVIAMDPSSKEAEQAANLILDSFNLVKDWKNLKDVAKAFYDQPGLGSPRFKQDVYDIYERASFKLIEVNYQESQDKKAAAQAYLAFYKEFPDSDVADLALNNASVYFHDLGDLVDEMNVRKILIEKFPKSKFYKDQVAALGFNYESIADFRNAAAWYEKLFALDKAHPAAKDALYSAGLFRRALGEWQQAIKDAEQYITAYPKDERIPDLTIDVAKTYEENAKWTEASKVYYTFFTHPPEGANLDQVFFARLHYGLALEKLGQTSKARKVYQEAIAAYEAAKAKGGDMKLAVEFIAQIEFKLAQRQLDHYLAMQISGPTRPLGRKQTNELLKKELFDKVKALTEVEKTYTEIVKTGAGQWGLAALVELGKAYENMADTLINSYIPDYLTPEQKDIYQMGLEDKAYTQTEKAVNVYAQALKKAYELNIYDDNTAYATRRLAELRPEEYPAIEEDLLQPNYTSYEVVKKPFEQEP